jgi:hypothetical protein
LAGGGFVALKDQSPFECGAYRLYQKCADLLNSPSDDYVFMVPYYPLVAASYLELLQFVKGNWGTS